MMAADMSAAIKRHSHQQPAIPIPIASKQQHQYFYGRKRVEFVVVVVVDVVVDDDGGRVIS